MKYKVIKEFWFSEDKKEVYPEEEISVSDKTLVLTLLRRGLIKDKDVPKTKKKKTKSNKEAS